ncbi:MAG TPA: general stress protein [Actinophytocola sp.]|uniref:general stress protein n=1 Tax=Actinophytocola sp. TaxID=1872138 RepID=UPI002DB8D3A0|nr:general stress protein [Actinophytocola sp.]HEU5474029.1 general stress protein [Actinophytocola sp.]
MTLMNDEANGHSATDPPGAQLRRTVATFASYGEAERAVDHLADQRFPVEHVAIVGNDVKMVEQVVGRLNWGRAALHGAGSGALVGALIGWLFGLFNWVQPLVASLVLAAYGLIFGAVVGAVFGLIAYALQGGRRDFSSIRLMMPSSYEVQVDPEVADEAARLLGQRAGPHTAIAR